MWKCFRFNVETEQPMKVVICLKKAPIIVRYFTKQECRNTFKINGPFVNSKPKTFRLNMKMLNEAREYVEPLQKLYPAGLCELRG